jgi:hypothetical protein
MNILNLPAPTAGAEFGQALGSLLGQAGSQGLDVYTTNKAMELLDQKIPRTETMEDTNVQGPQFYNQRQQEEMLRETPWYLRSKVKGLMEQRNLAAGQEIQNANIYKDLASDIIKQIMPGAGPQTLQLFGDYAIKLYREGVNTAQATTELTKMANTLAAAGGAFEQSLPITFSPLEKLYRSVTGTAVPEETIKESLATFYKPFKDLGANDEFTKIATDKGYPPVMVEEIKGAKINPQVTNFLNKEIKNVKPENLKNQIEEVLKIDPNTNLILLREKFVNTGKIGFVDFLQAASEISNENKIKYNNEQLKQLGTIQRPEKDAFRKIKESLYDPKTYKSILNFLARGSLIRTPEKFEGKK